MKFPLTALTLLLCALIAGSGFAVTKNGFDLDDASVPSREIRQGGVPRDGIFALSHPDFIPVSSVDYLQDDSRVLGVVIGNVAKAYPINILTVHEVVNDTIGTQHFVVSYCPLCGTGIVFASNVGAPEDGGAFIFAVSGLLYNSDLLLYDRYSESLWSQITGESISGKFKGLKLPRLPVLHTSWKAWQVKYPESQLMQGDKQFEKFYAQQHYPGYDKSRKLLFRVNNRAPKIYHPKEQVLGVEINGVQKVYAFSELRKQDKAVFADEVGGKRVLIHWQKEALSAHVTDLDGKVVISSMGYWFAWYAFYPQTLLFKSK